MFPTCQDLSENLRNVPLKPYKPVEGFRELVAYCLRRLGGGVHKIEISEEQCQERLTDALQFYREWNSESVKEKWLIHRVTQADIDSGWIHLSPDIMDVLDILSWSFLYGTAAIEGIDSPEYIFKQMWWGVGGGVSFGGGDAWGTSGNGGLIAYESAFEWIDTMRQILVPVTEFTYRSRSHKLELYRQAKKALVLDYPIILHCNTIIDPNDPENGWIWDNVWLKEYLTALLGVQLGNNLLKYDNVTLTGGITLNKSWLDQWKEEKLRLEKQLKDEFQEPPRFFFG